MLNGVSMLSKELLDKFSDIVNDEENPIRYLAIDPGKANGICGYNEKYELQFMYTIKSADMIRVMHCFLKVVVCVVEDFMLYPNKMKEQVYSDMETSRVIGRIEDWSILKQAVLVKQPARIKPTAYKWLGIPQPTKSDKRNHEKDAHAHFIYWAIKNGKMPAEHLFRQSSA